MSKSSNISAIERTTNLAWADWVEYLDSHEASNLPHRDIAGLAEDRMGRQVQNSGWWAQGVAVAYEQHIGRRLPGQASDGSFQFAVSRTIDANLDAALEHWVQVMQSQTDFNGRHATSAARISGSDKWRYWRIDLDDGTTISVDIGRKADKSSLAVNHRKIHDPDQVPTWKDYWRSLLGALPN